MNKTDKILKCLEKDFCLSESDLKRIIKDFHSQMNRGLRGEKSSLKMLPAYVDKPAGNEQGRFIALDLGGTNFRILSLELKGKGRVVKLLERKFVLDKKIISSTAEEMFGFIGRCIKKFIYEEKITPHTNPLPKGERRNQMIPLPKGERGQGKGTFLTGFTFSFPVKQTTVNSGILLHWTKDFTVKGVVGKDVVELLNNALLREGIHNVRINALVNDTVGTLLYCSYKDTDCDIAVILGTGTNACYQEELRRIIKYKGPKRSGEKMIVNIEWGNFNKLKTTVYDKLLDKNSENKGSQILEKMVSGMYLGEICRLIMMDLADKGLLFNGMQTGGIIKTKWSFKTDYMPGIEQDNTAGLSKIKVLLDSLHINGSSLQDRALVKKICGLVSCRSAFIIAGAMAAVITKIDPDLSRKHTVAVDGSVYEKYEGFSEKIEAGLMTVFGKRAKKIKLSLTKDGSGTGAAITAAMSSPDNMPGRRLSP